MTHHPHIELAQHGGRLRPVFVAYQPTHLERLVASWWAIRTERKQVGARMAPMPGQRIGQWL